jgi:hypothetical protein
MKYISYIRISWFYYTNFLILLHKFKYSSNPRIWSVSDGRQLAATYSVALTNSTALIRSPPHRILNAPIGIFPCRLTVLSSVATAYYYQATRCHRPEYDKIEKLIYVVWMITAVATYNLYTMRILCVIQFKPKLWINVRNMSFGIKHR